MAEAAPLDGRPQPARGILPRAAAEALRRRGAGGGDAVLGLGQAYREVSFTLHRRRDPRHRRRHRLRPRGADAHSGRLRAARRRHAVDPWAAGALRDARRGGRRRDRLRAARAAGRGPGDVPAGGRQHHAGRSREPHPRTASSTPARSGRAPAAGWSGSDPHPRHPDALPQPLRRQPAEGGAGQVAGGGGASSASSTIPPAASMWAPRRRSTTLSPSRGHRRGPGGDPHSRHAGGDARASATPCSSCATAPDHPSRRGEHRTSRAQVDLIGHMV